MNPTTTAGRVRDLRPLDPFQSIKIKLGVLVGATCSTSAIFVWAGLHNDLATRYTLPLSVIFALLVTQLLAQGHDVPAARDDRGGAGDGAR